MNNMRGFFVNDGWLIPTAPRRFVKLHLGVGCPVFYRYELVAGRKRKIKVMFHDDLAEELTTADILAAAKIADKRGWKKVVIMTDYYDGLGLEVFNMSGFNTAWKNRDAGVFLKTLITQ
jgi:hypothetical protein